MAVVGHAYVVVRALTDKINSDIEKGFSGAGDTANKSGQNIGNNLAKGMSRGLGNIKLTSFTDKVKDSLENSVQLAESFTSMVRKGYAVQGAFGAVVGSIGALVGGLGALIGVAGGAATALVAVGGAAITAKVGMSIASFALKGVGAAATAATKANGGLGKSLKEIAFDAEAAALGVDRAAITLENAREAVLRTQDLPSGSRVRREAELAYKEAELAYRRAQDAKKEGGKDAAGGGTDPYAGLTPAQKQFAKYLAGLKPIMDDLREAAAKGFLPILQGQIQKLIDAKLPEILEEKFESLGIAAGKAVENFTDIFLSGDNLQDFQDILDDMAENLPAFGTILGNVFSGFLSIIEAADPLTREFIGFLESKTSAFRDFLDSKQATGELTTFFNRAGDIAGGFGTVFGNIFGGLGNMIAANFGPGSGGDMILQWLIKLTDGFKNADAIGLELYFQAAADNFIAMGDALSGAADTIVKSGSNPAIGEFWRTLDAGSQSFAAIIRGSIEAAPALGTTLKLITDIIAQFTDAAAVIAFFDTINFALGGLAETLRTIKPLLDFVGPIFATISALTLLRGALVGVSSIFLGFTMKIAAAIGSLFGFNAAQALTKVGLVTLQAQATATGVTMTAALGPIAWIVAGVTAAVVGLVVAFNGIKSAQMEKATEGVTRGFKQGADAATLWGEATKAVADGPTKDAIGDIGKLRENLGRLATAQKRGGLAGFGDFVTRGLADSLESVGRSLGDLGTNDLPAAQASFKKFTKELGLTNSEVIVALDEMDDYKTALIEQADQLGINIRTMDGQIDKQKLANFALGEGEIAQRKANEELQKNIDKLATQARSFIDYQGSLQKNADKTKAWAQAQADSTEDATDTWEDYWDGQSFNMDIYLQDLEDQVTAARNWQTNIGKISSRLAPEVLDQIVSMGEAGSQLVASLVDGVNDQEEIDRLNAIGTTAGKTLYDSAQKALDKKPIKFNYITLPDGTTTTGRTSTPIVIPASPTRKDGGIIGFADGGFIKKYAPGGPVVGPGTGRSDSIPAMLSNGEFVINARATAENRELLEAVNSNKEIPGSTSITMNVYPSEGMDERELAEIVSRKIAFAMTKGGY